VPLEKRRNKALQFDDKDICKYELVALCPNRLFRNTKSDLGEHPAAATAAALLHPSAAPPKPQPVPDACVCAVQVAVGLRYTMTT
jgi:hypothetical protein